MSYAIRQRVRAIMDRVNGATQWPWRAKGSTIGAPGVPLDAARTARNGFDDFGYYGGEMVCESIGTRDADLVERAPEDLAFLCAVVSELLADRRRLDFLLDEGWVCRDRKHVDRLAADRDGVWEPTGIVRADYEIVEPTTEDASHGNE